MTGTVTRKGSISALALAGLRSTVALASAAIPPVAASAPPATESRAASEWPAASESSSGGAPSLTDEALAPQGGTGSQLWLGLGLLALSLAAVFCALAAQVTRPCRAVARAGTGRGSRTSFPVGPEPRERAAGQSE